MSRLSPRSLARLSARRPRTTIAVWAALLIAAGLAIALLLGGGLTDEDDFTGSPESVRASALLTRAFGDAAPGAGVSEAVVVRSSGAAIDAPPARAQVAGLERELADLGDVASVSSFLDGDPDLVSPDRSTAVLLVELAGDVEPVVEAVEAADGRGGLEVLVTGEESVSLDLERTAGEDLLRGETVGIGLALVVLLLVAGAVVAAVLPMVVAIAAIVGALGLTALVGQAFTLSFFVVNMLVMMGLAVGIDYSLLIVSRVREERAAGRSTIDAIALAGATASRSVALSGVIVVLALVGMFLVPHTIFRSLATGAILAVVTAVAAALTLLPAALALLGGRVDALRLPLARRRARGDRDGLWTRVAGAAVRRPFASLVAGVAVLIALAVPYAGVQLGSSGTDTLPDHFSTKRAQVALEGSFGPQRTATADVAVSGDMDSAEVRGAVGRLRARLAGDDAFGPADLRVAPAGDAGLLSVAVAGDPVGRRAVEAVGRLRDEHIPAAFARVPAEALVAGDTAGEIDFQETADRYLPIVLAFVLGLSFVLLAAFFRSLVVPAVAIVMNLLSVGAAYGVLVLVFQDGVGAGLLGLREVGTIESWLPLFLFTVLFGLSMDYHVFLISRIREHYLRTGDARGAVVGGVRATARIITGAALIMVAVFAGFASGELTMFQQMGLGLGVAVLLDATLVRSVLVPAAMALLGRWNWYLPRVLARAGASSPGKAASR